MSLPPTTTNAPSIPIERSSLVDKVAALDPKYNLDNMNGLLNVDMHDEQKNRINLGVTVDGAVSLGLDRDHNAQSGDYGYEAITQLRRDGTVVSKTTFDGPETVIGHVDAKDALRLSEKMSDLTMTIDGKVHADEARALLSDLGKVLGQYGPAQHHDDGHRPAAPSQRGEAAAESKVRQ